ncbi:patched domain-containing protein 1 [Hippocampus comes]|uniref:patched domain-containing protein 1 n=1 Tax=Hippocampus comes TaxID=109280 RepID=UPI00094E2B8D|nr:PREDICTED: patched domain-containing protein 1 [Hippocampus comes]XP_019740340.1 PREDICTED: patched domain-containing protein 1 [Hippocampus comes]XP_019740341.1 PREDICTED: patched domain-containing protein 1 [Hippocampus comes]
MQLGAASGLSAGWERLERPLEAGRPRAAMLRQVLHAGLSGGFRALGRFVASQPVFFASTPVLLAVLLGASFSRYRVEEDVQSLLAPKHSLAKIEGNLVDSLFPINHSKHALYSDLQTPGRYGRVIVTARRGSVLEPPNLDAVLKLHRLIYHMQVTVPPSGPTSFNYSFSHLCLPDDKNVCIVDDIIRAMEEMRSAQAANRSAPVLRYPITRLADGRQAYIGHQLGGVQIWAPNGAARGLRGEGVRSARALQLTYYLQARGGLMEGVASQWEKTFCRQLREFAALHPQLGLYPATSSSLRTDFQFSSVLARRPLLASLGLCGVLAVLCCSMRDCVRSKPWLGMLALLSVTLAGLTAAGILNLSGSTYNSTYLGIPFVMLGHGLFGSFEMLSSWRRTREDQHVKERVASVFEDVMLRFSGSTALHLMTLGLAASPLTNMEAVRLFCRTAALAVSVSYAYMLSFYSSCLVFTGYLETGYRHGCFCRRVPKQDRLNSKPAWYRCLMYTRYQDEAQTATGTPHGIGHAPHPPSMEHTRTYIHPRAANNHLMNTPIHPHTSDPCPQDSHLLLGCVRRCYGDWITNTYVKPFVVLLYLVYISFGLMGFLQVAQGSEPSSLVAMDTATASYTRAQQRYFSSYSPVIGFYIYESAPYWNTTVQRDLLEYAKGFQRISWLEAYLAYLSERNQSTSSARENFTHTLRHGFLREPQFAHFADDIIFAERGPGEEPDVAASRIFLVAKTTENKREEMSVLLDTLRRLSLTSRVRFLIFNPSFVYLDRYAAAVSSPLRHSLLAVLFLLGLSSLAVVEPLVSVWLGLTMLSVQFGVLGFMTLWGVELDCVSVLCLILALGHAADCSGPLLCGFAAGRGDSRTHWVRVALERHGVPSLQAFLCYGAALAPVGSVRSNLTRTLFRCLALTAGCSALHTLAFLPTLLTFLPPSKNRAHRPPAGDGPRQEVECVEMNDGTRVVDQITTV